MAKNRETVIAVLAVLLTALGSFCLALLMRGKL